MVAARLAAANSRLRQGTAKLTIVGFAGVFMV